MANVAVERKKERNRNAVDNCGRGDNGRGIAGIFLTGGAFFAGVLLAAIIASKRKKGKTKTKDLGMRERKETLDSCKGAMNRQEDDIGLLSILPLDVEASIEQIEQECRPGSSTNKDEKTNRIFQEKELSQQFIEGLNKGEAPIVKSKIEKEGDSFLHLLEAFPPDASSLHLQNLQAEKIVDSNIEKEGDVSPPHLKAFPPCSTSSLDQQNLQAKKMEASLVSQLLHVEGCSSLASILPSQNGGSDAGRGSHCFVSVPSLIDDIAIGGGGGDGVPSSDGSISLPSLEEDGNDIGTSSGVQGNDRSLSMPSLGNDENDIGSDGGGCDGDSFVPLLSSENHGNNNGGGGSLLHCHGCESFVSLQSLEDDGKDSAGGDGANGSDSAISMRSLEDDCDDTDCNSGCGSRKNDGYVSPSTLEDYRNDGGAGGAGRSGDSSVTLLSLEDDGIESGGSDGHHDSVFLPLLQNDHKVDGVGSGNGSVSPLLLQDDGCAGNRSGRSGGSGVDDCDGDSSLSLLLLQDDGGDEISNSDDYDMEHEKENSSVAFELENSAPGAITIPVAAEAISCGSYSSGPEGFSAGTSPVTTWPQLSISGCSKQISETNRMPFGISYAVGDDDDEDDDQSKYTHFEQQQRSGLDVRKIFEEDTRCTQEVAEEVSWSRDALSILQSVDTNLLILSVGAVLLLFVVEIFIHVNMS